MARLRRPSFALTTAVIAVASAMWLAGEPLDPMNLLPTGSGLHEPTAPLLWQPSAAAASTPTQA